MRLAKVRGTVVSTVKDDSLMGIKLLLIQLISDSGDLQDDCEVAVDMVGAGVGEWVLVSRGSAARQQQRHLQKPIDAAIVAIIDTVSLDTGLLYDKREDFR
ncbi:Ethanolamine utilization protein EutN/carboxysome structural protein Ccml [Synechococcus sp. PCC 7335]|uniref:EutN/CcmL family microcompartment protein n=1 Tax=Synechococcus sp. (strain ATCC 29403 / PCC 7335) TaxID=91464 RepID=UPI00017EB125|nr:EutN/CcmL family microcompartment protein [Synechococcus sp. PCC 7335]EDX85814.1 Ethanolamine utilization protein EutN/carboxysome structural protein Ccml [Synechococcus sp. PCC 7335]